MTIVTYFLGTLPDGKHFSLCYCNLYRKNRVIPSGQSQIWIQVFIPCLSAEARERDVERHSCMYSQTYG